MSSTAAELGVLGVGSIAEAIVTGLGDDFVASRRVLLSPRGTARVAALSARFSKLEVAASNQDLVDRADTVLVCLRPQDAEAELTGLTFRPGQRVVSVVAAASLETFGRWVAPAEAVARAVPLPAVARREGLTPVHPADPATLDLFGRLGETLAVDDETAFDALSVSSATIAAHVAYLASISDWLAGRGLAAADASRYVVAIFASVAETLRDSPDDLAHLAADHATPGGLNEQFHASLAAAGVFDQVERSLGEVERRVLGDG